MKDERAAAQTQKVRGGRAQRRPPRSPARQKGGGDTAPAVAAGTLQWFAVAAPGLEAVVLNEVAELPGVAQVQRVEGGVEFSGGLEVGMRANLWLRVATRVVLRLGTVEARQFTQLRRRLALLPWRTFVPRGRPLRVEASAARCRLYHTGAIAENVGLAMADALGPLPAAGDEADEDEATRVLVRGRGDIFVVSLDASGTLLHRRGWRPEGGAAPLRETLAAGLLALSGHDPSRPFVDPMCGSGTIALEACAAALGVAPGLARAFAFERWPCFEPAVWDRLRNDALTLIRSAPPAPLWAFDRDPSAVQVARRNAERAGFLAHLRIESASLGQRPAPASAGLVVINAPYGRRLSAGEVAPVLRAAGRALRSTYAGWRVGMLVSDRAHEGFVGLPRPEVHALFNGGLRVRLLVSELPAPRSQPSPAVDYH